MGAILAAALSLEALAAGVCHAAGLQERRERALKVLGGWQAVLGRVDDESARDRSSVLAVLKEEVEAARSAEELDEVETRLLAWKRAVMAHFFPGNARAQRDPDRMLAAVGRAWASRQPRKVDWTRGDSRTRGRLEDAAGNGALDGLYTGGGNGPAGPPRSKADPVAPLSDPEGLWGGLEPATAVPPQDPGPSDPGRQDDAAGPADDYEQALKFIAALEEEKRHPSVAVGPTSNGKLKFSMELPVEGYGYAHLHPERRRNYGTDNMVLGLMWLAAKFQKAHPAHPGLRYGDLSAREGGEVSGHKTHENGRNADILFLAADAGGSPADNTTFQPFDRNGARGRLRFDAAGNWDVMALVAENPYWKGHTDAVLAGGTFRQLVLRHGRQTGDRERVAQAQSFLRAFDENHDDHYHVQIGANYRRSEL